jgi:phage terminase large subunit GpA-like protein
MKGALVESELERSRRRRRQSKLGFYARAAGRMKKVDETKDIVYDWDDPNEWSYWDKAFNAFRPPPRLTVSEWADTYRIIPGEFAAEPGQWSTSKMECMRAIMDACSPSDSTQKIVFVKPVQTGGTEAAILNTIGFNIDVNPRSMLVVFPTLELAEGFSKERLDPMIDVCPTLKDKVSEVNTRGPVGKGASTVRKKRYPGGFLNLVGANSTSGLSSRPVPVVIMDEVDRCIENAGREGNPTKLLSNRATTFFDRKEIFIGSPVKAKDESGILQMFEDSNQAVWELECPNDKCKHYHLLVWDNIDLDLCEYKCPSCEKTYAQWQWQDQPGQWHILNPSHKTKGFFINALVSPWLSWIDLVAEYKEALRLETAGDDSLMKPFVNTKLCLPYRKLGMRIEVDLYNARREVYPCHAKEAEIPDGVLLLTASADVQDSFIKYEIVGWGRGRESWGIETGSFQGDPKSASTDVWEKLDHYVYLRIFSFVDNTRLRVRVLFVDSGGHCTSEVYKYCKARHPRAFAIRGIGGIGKPILYQPKKQGKGNYTVINLGTDTLKDELHSRLNVEKQGPGYCHFPMLENGLPAVGYDQGFFDEIVSEQRILKYNQKGFANYEWHKNRTDANEALDLRCYNRAALEFTRVKLEQIKRDELTSIPEAEIHTIQIGTGKRIAIAEKKTGSTNKQYGASKQTTINVPDSPKPGYTPPKRPQAYRGGATTTSF